MTKVQLEYDLVRPLTDGDAAAVADVHSWYGIQRVQLAPSLDRLLVEYDASRLSEKDVEAVLQRFGLPIQRKWTVPSMPAATLPDLFRARDYLAARFNERVALADAPAEAGLSPFYFHRMFAAAFNETPHPFVTRLRVEHAKKLLLAGNHSVTGVCFDTGYESLGSFSTRFRTLTGLSPAEFRRESRRVFGTSGRYWPLYYMPVCFQHFYAGIG